MYFFKYKDCTICIFEEHEGSLRHTYCNEINKHLVFLA